MRFRRALLVCAVLVLSVGAATAAAGEGNGNSDAAQACQKGGWSSLSPGAGEMFRNAGECTSFVARGGTFYTDDPGEAEPVGADVSLRAQTSTAGTLVDFFVYAKNDGPEPVTATVATNAQCVRIDGSIALTYSHVDTLTLSPGAEQFVTSGSYSVWDCTIFGYSQVTAATMLDPDSTPNNYANGFTGPAVEDDETVFSVAPTTE